MLLSIIFVLTQLPIVLILYLFHRAEFRMKGTKKYTLIVRITDDMLEEERFSAIKKEYEGTLKRVFYIAMFSIVPGVVLLNSPLTGYATPVMFIMLFPLFFYIYFSHRLMYRCRRNLLDLKQKYVEEDVRYLDLLTSRMKNQKNPKKIWFMIPALMNLLLLFLESHTPVLILVISSYVLILTAFTIFQMIARMPSKVYSFDSGKNLLLNQYYRQKWTGFFLSISFFSSLFHLLIAFVFFRYFESFTDIHIGVLVVIALFGFIPLLHAFRIHRSFQIVKENVLKGEEKLPDCTEEERYYYEDGFWGFQYNNPNHPSVLVSAPTGFGQMVNIGTRKGRIFYYGSKWVFYIVMTFAVGTTIFEDIVFPKMEVSEEGIRIYQTLYPYSVTPEDIEKVEWTEEETGSLYKRTGTATERILRGDFHLQGEGMVKVYILTKESFPKIIIYLKNSEVKRIYFSGEDVEGTREIFEKIRDFFPEKCP